MQQNWFQNRRAKSKQDAKKQQGAFNLFQAQQNAHVNYSGSDSEVSPAFSSPDYYHMMQQCTADDDQSNALGISQMSHYQEHGQVPASVPLGPQFANSMSEAEQLRNLNYPHEMPDDMFDSPQELNRRTLTQDQFDAIAQNGGMMQEAGDFNQDVLAQMFPGLSNGDSKQQLNFEFPASMEAPQSSYDSTIPSTMSETSAHAFPSSTHMQDHASLSASSSEWNDSRSSSLSIQHHDETFARIPGHQQQTPASTSTWQPGQSVPVDFNALSQEFRQVAQTAQARQSPQTYHQHEQPLAWPADEAYQRRDSQTSTMLAQQMGNVGIHTPQSQQPGTFKSPAPPSSIAARRQRQRPAPLGLASMRSQSYSGAMQPGSPSQSLQQHHNLTPGQPLRKIKSSNMINGVAQGRVQKSMPGSAQRSPLSWTFADAMNSPKAARHVSSQSGSNLAPPTPMSPNEFQRSEQARHMHHWQSSASRVGRQASISETDLEHGLPYVSAAPAPPQNFSSPPHTPLYHQQQFMHHRVGNNVILENTPPQSAPASQQCFPSSAFNPPPQPMHQHPPPPQMQAYVHPQQHQMMHPMGPEQQYQMAQMSMPPNQHFTITTAPPPQEMPVQFAPHGIPVVNAQGQLQMMAVPQNMQFVQPSMPHSQPQQQPQPVQMHTPPNIQYPFVSTSSPSPVGQVMAQPPKVVQPTASEFFVHEYNPPPDVKRAATPRKAVDSGPKNYTFANQTPEHFEKGKKGADAKGSSTNGNSPASATSSS